MRLTFRLLVILLSCVPAAATAATGQEAAIVILGDSLSAAYGMEMRQSWPNLLQDRLEEDGHAYRVFNSSIAGDTTQGGLTRLPRLLETHSPAIVLIELGGNDGLRGLPVDVTRRNLSDMIERSQAAGARVIVAEMRIPPNYGRTYTEKFNETYHLLQQRYGIVLLPFVLQEIALQEGLMMDDGIHPTPEAQPLILDQVWAVLEPLL